MAWEQVVPAKPPKRPGIPRIAIGIPHQGTCSFEWFEKTYVQLKYAPRPEFEKMTFAVRSYSVVHSRNMIVKFAIENDCDYIFWLDSDIIFESKGKDPKGEDVWVTINPNDALKRLLDCNAAIASGLYRAKQQMGFNYAAWLRNPDPKNPRGYLPIGGWSPGTNWIEVAVVGMGCCLEKIEVVKNIKEPWFHWEMPDEISEDFFHLEKAKTLGYNTMVCTDVTATHLGNIAIRIDGSVRTLES